MNKKNAPLLIALTIVALLLAVSLWLGAGSKNQPEVTGESITLRPSGNPINVPPTGSTASQSGEEPRQSPRDFEAFTTKFLKELPPMEILRTQPKHAVHPGLLDAYTRSGSIARAAILQPELRELAYEALESCANLKGYDLSVRGLCLRKLREIRQSTGDQSYDERNRIKNLRELDSLLRRSFGS